MSYNEQLYISNLYKGILHNNQKFKSDNEKQIKYDFLKNELITLSDRFYLRTIAGQGTDLDKAHNLLVHFRKRINVSTNGASTETNSIEILGKYYKNKKNELSYITFSKLMQEIFMACGVPARQVFMYPYSPYDVSSYVVVEIYNRSTAKWVLIDTFNCGYYVDADGEKLSLLETRELFARNVPVTFSAANNKLKNIEKEMKKSININIDFMKNAFYFTVNSIQTFGEEGERLYFIPKNFSIVMNQVTNNEFRLGQISSKNQEYQEFQKERIDDAKSEYEPDGTCIQALEVCDETEYVNQ